mmetsp:Transcript_28508/g.77183  ORF Transcript_28508/g.77183 Transcript_28508/m.77183 type:complete len:98 (-) Transcript_28508:2136-2429(-)
MGVGLRSPFNPLLLVKVGLEQRNEECPIRNVSCRHTRICPRLIFTDSLSISIDIIARNDMSATKGVSWTTNLPNGLEELQTVQDTSPHESERKQDVG